MIPTSPLCPLNILTLTHPISILASESLFIQELLTNVGKLPHNIAVMVLSKLFISLRLLKGSNYFMKKNHFKE